MFLMYVSLVTFHSRWNIYLGVISWGFGEIASRILSSSIVTPKGTLLRRTASFEPSCLFMRRAIQPVRDCEKEVIKTRNLLSGYISRMLGDTPVEPMVMKVCTFVKIVNVKIYTTFAVNMWKEFGFWKEPNSGLSYRNLPGHLQHCAGMWKATCVWNVCICAFLKGVTCDNAKTCGI